jgi:hypothetical protein
MGWGPIPTQTYMHTHAHTHMHAYHASIICMHCFLPASTCIHTHAYTHACILYMHHMHALGKRSNTYIHTHRPTYIYTHARIHKRMHTMHPSHACTSQLHLSPPNTYIHAHIHAHIHTYTHMHTHTYMHALHPSHALHWPSHTFTLSTGEHTWPMHTKSKHPHTLHALQAWMSKWGQEREAFERIESIGLSLLLPPPFHTTWCQRGGRVCSAGRPPMCT